MTFQKQALALGSRVMVVHVTNGGKFKTGHVGTVTEIYGVRPTYRIDNELGALYSREEIAPVVERS